MKFLRNLLASCLGTGIAFVVVILLFIGFVSLVGNAEKVVVKSNSVLKINLKKRVQDYAPANNHPMSGLIEDDRLQMSHILNAIENAKTDPKIKGISIENLVVNAGVAQLQSIRKKLKEFKESGKFVTAYADLYTQKNYYLSSVADEVYVLPFGSVDFRGLSTERMFYKDFQEKFGVKMEVVRHGKYKSAVEGYLENEMSEANREQITSFLNSIWATFLKDIGESRELSEENLNQIADELLGRSSDLAIENKLIDGGIYKDDYNTKLKELAGVDKINTVSIEDYISSGKGVMEVKGFKNTIAVIYAQGEMLYGKGNEQYIGQESMVKAIKSLRKNKGVKAVVLRVNSPGGVALTGDIILQELNLLKEEKPLVVSMGDVAASGGYWISAKADKIFAEPTTITGSIGVFGTIPNMSGLASDLGINAEQVATNKQSISYSFYEPMSEAFYEEQKEGVERVYQQFLEIVAEGRDISIEEADRIAQGRVWTGKEALENGLVDELGGLEDAIKAAALQAEIEGDYRISEYPRYTQTINDVLDGFLLVKTKEEILKEELGVQNYEIYNEVLKMSRLEGVQALMPYEIVIR
ncbi:signal peptide peptidase SppA [Urechidicola sp. KH5]